MTMDVPIVIVGEAPAMKGKGRMLSHGVTELSIECLPEKVPPQIEVDISGLEELDQAIHIKDIVLDPDIEIQTEPDLMVVKVIEVVVKAEEEVVEVEEEAAEEAEGAKPEEEAAEKPTAEAGTENSPCISRTDE